MRELWEVLGGVLSLLIGLVAIAWFGWMLIGWLVIDVFTHPPSERLVALWCLCGAATAVVYLPIAIHDNPSLRFDLTKSTPNFIFSAGLVIVFWPLMLMVVILRRARAKRQ